MRIRASSSGPGLPIWWRRSWPTPDCRSLLLTGEPGSGKTALLAWLARRSPDRPRYFIRRDSQVPLNTGDARSLLLAVGHQLAFLHPGLFHPDRLELVVRQRVGEIARGRPVVGIWRKWHPPRA
jgi:hypothetical protein